MDYKRGEASMHGWRCPESNSRIQVVNSEAGSTAVRVGDAWFHADPVTNAQVFYLASYFDYGAGCFVPKHHRRFHHKGPNLTVFVIMHVAAADTDRMNRNLYIARPHGSRQIDFS